MTLLDAIILGIVEGITEFLPISSTGHLTLAAEWLGLVQTNFTKTFEISIQLGAILAVVAFYGRTLLKNRGIIGRVCVAFIPTGIIGLGLYKIIKNVLIGNNTVVLWALLVGGVVIILTEIFHREKPSAVSNMKNITYPQAFFIGLAQAVAVIPGVSRSAATIIGGMFLGLKRITATEFSFLLAIPTMAAATGLDVMKNFQSFSIADLQTLSVGFFCSFVVALITIKFLLDFLKTHTFIAFGVYRVLLTVWLLF